MPAVRWGPRGMLRGGHILELEILLHGPDNLLWRHYHLPHLRGLDRRKAISPWARQAIARATHRNRSMEPTAPWQGNFRELATDPCRGLSLSR
jgi:hypothetical protein